MSDRFAGLRWKDWSFVPTSGPAQRRTRMGLNLLLFGYLGFTFLAVLILYLFTALGRDARPAESIPTAFWFSTVAALVGGFCLRAAVQAMRRERQRAARGLVALALLSGVGFGVGQAVGVWQMLDDYRPAVRPSIAAPGGGSYLDPDAKVALPMAALITTLVALHGAHFLGGLCVLVVAAVRTFAGRYDHEYHAGLLLTARYWTFLDVSWLVMLATFYLTL
ncbi:cytochrome c oxidase subunit 3 [Alienimonas californiensis]|uniref:Cytochrome c oxidase subunit III n=1 Tax=Alienimonas californiensis TaxID=2527989 RepID=A0A517PBT9_9PLAN|nr:cytochrome c oxidase subunit 3 [Alienimonas californiensis]QDT16853.1 Cytochrome c oxidase subunit III [Alienimonas californiensis]